MLIFNARLLREITFNFFCIVLLSSQFTLKAHSSEPVRVAAMSTFAALNVEPDEDSEEEIDNTKEIQIEEALKLYQNALKLHSQGPEFFNEAEDAYKSLFTSEIFKYPESTSEYQRAHLQDFDAQDFDILEEVGQDTLDANDTVSSALPQTIYLSYKNHGQFVLDKLKNYLRFPTDTNQASREKELLQLSKKAITCFAEALERDDTDLELWRKSARVGDALGSHRLLRFCLESVLEGDEDGLDERLEQLGLEEAFAIEDLRDLLRVLRDDLSQSKVSLKRPRKALLNLLKKRIDSYKYLPSGLKDNSVSSAHVHGLPPSRCIAVADDGTWSAVGKAILDVVLDEAQECNSINPTTAIEIRLPEQKYPISHALPVISQKSSSDGKNCAVDLEMSDYQSNNAAVIKSTEDSRDITTKATPTSSEHITHPHPHGSRVDEAKESLGHVQHQTPASPEIDGGKLQNTTGTEQDTNHVEGPSRKRSSASAANEEAQDGGRVKSKRIRARESNAEILAQPDDVAFDQTRYFEDRLEVFAHADQWVFGTVDSLLSKVGIEDLGTIEDIKRVSRMAEEYNPSDESNINQSPESVLFKDLRDVVRSWNDEKGRITSHVEKETHHNKGVEGPASTGLNIFLEHSQQGSRKPTKAVDFSENQGISQFCEHINTGWVHPKEAAFLWLLRQFKPALQSSIEALDGNTEDSIYLSQRWPGSLKDTITRLLQDQDEYIYNRLHDSVMNLGQDLLNRREVPGGYLVDTSKLIQSIYEVHLDIYASINGPDGGVNHVAQAMQRNRLKRWGFLSCTLVAHLLSFCEDANSTGVVTLRYIWSCTMNMALTDGDDREYIIFCYGELKRILSAMGNPEIHISNNATIPEISSAAVDREISKINSLDFFTNILSPSSEDPIYLIESIEPILEPSSVQLIAEDSHSVGTYDDSMTQSFHDTRADSRARDLAAFLDQGDATLRLFLWRRLEAAYDSIQYPPKVVSCCLRSIEVILREFWSHTHLGLASERRQINFLKRIRNVDELLGKALKLVLEQPKTSLDCLDMDHLRSSISSLAQFLRILHSFALLEDSIRVGQTSLPEVRPAAASKSLEQFKNRLRNMYVRSWVLQYALLKEAMEQNKDLFETPFDDQIHYLRSVHNALGVRSACRCSNKVLLRLMKTEILTLPTEDSYEFDVAQVLFDLHGLKFTSGFDEVVDHGCPTEPLDRETAISMIDFVMLQASKINIKDLPKSDLKSTMDTMQTSIEWVKSTALSFNKRVMSAFLKSSVNPSDLFRAIQGIGDVSLVSVQTDSTRIADKGWYFLHGFAALTRFRSQKRITPIPTDDLDLAATFFRADLEHGTGRWETWYRLAQVYDLRLEEDIAWSADKLNTHRPHLAALQRKAIHSYSMAVAASMRTAELTPETRKKLSELYTDFGFRIYASTREPLSMEVFSLGDFIRHFSNGNNQQMYKSKPFREMSAYSAWNFASYLFRQAILDRPDHWM